MQTVFVSKWLKGKGRGISTLLHSSGGSGGSSSGPYSPHRQLHSE